VAVMDLLGIVIIFIKKNRNIQFSFNVSIFTSGCSYIDNFEDLTDDCFDFIRIVAQKIWLHKNRGIS
jgi:hypothetical protein